MFRFVTPMLLGASLLLGSSLINHSPVIAGEKPLLSVAIKKAIDTRGVAAAKQQFAKDYAANKNRYQVDTPDLMVLVRGYAAARNGPAANAVLAIAQPYMLDAAMVTRDAKAKKDAKQHRAMSKKIKAQQKVAIADHNKKRKKDIADYKAADARRVAKYEAQRKPVFFKSGGAPVKPTAEDNWYIIRTLNVDAKGVSFMSFPAELHKAALAAGFRSTRRGGYSKGPVSLSAGVYPGRDLHKLIRYDMRDLSPAQWETYAKKIMRQLGKAGPGCIRRSGSVARLACRFNYETRSYYARLQIRGDLRKGKGNIKLKFQQGP